MKLCTYCGRENQDEATACSECGTSEFAAIPLTTTDVTSEDAETVADAPIELQRCRDLESVRQITRILDDAGIAYRRSSPPAMFDISKIGADGDTEVILSVPRSLYTAARAAMESEYLKIELPQDHYLLRSTDEELIEIVGESWEWSAFDVAHARRLINERGIDLKKVEGKRAEHLSQLRRGRPASTLLILFGWIFSVLGGLIGFGIAWSLCYMKEKTPHGEFFSYDEQSRAIGAKMLRVSVTVIAAIALLRLSSLLSR